MADSGHLQLRGVRVHNLRRIDVDIPLGKLTAITGVSGAGKTSLALDTLYAEAQRRYLQSFSVAARQFLERFDRPDAEHIGDLPAAVAVTARDRPPPGTTVGSLTELNDHVALLFTRAGVLHCPRCGREVTAQGAEDVAAAVTVLPASARVTVAFPDRPEPGEETAWAAALVEEGFIRAQVGAEVLRLGEQRLPDLAEREVLVLVDRLQAGSITPERLSDSVETAFRRGDDRLVLLTDQGGQRFDRRLRCGDCDVELTAPQPRLFDRRDPLGACPPCKGTGLAPKTSEPCSACHGAGWNDAALSVRLGDQHIAQVQATPLADLQRFLAQLPSRADTRLILEQIQRRLDLLAEVGIGYLTLERGVDTLALGELQRLRLCSVLASNLVGALYILDEPAAGLHPREIERVLALLLRLRDAGNTVVVVEHDPLVIRGADWLIDLGPGAAEEGGNVVYQGPPAGIDAVEASVTGAYLSGRESIALPEKRRTPHGWLQVDVARLRNLADVSVEFPLGVCCVVTGPSGAGKSTLVEDVLYPLVAEHKHKKGLVAPPGTKVRGASEIGDVVLIRQEPLPRTARSNAATYLKIFDEVRTLFAQTTDAKIRNFGPGHFSFNQPGGRCETCEGQGALAVDMQFLADVAMTCPECHGSRYQKEVLAIKVRSLSIAEVLDLSVREAFRFFRAQRSVQHKLKRLIDVGLEYVRLGQPLETLSGGEAQRLRLAGHLAAVRKPRCLFILSEPAAGLHPADVQRLLDCFDGLVAAGHSLLIIENQADVLQAADWVIEMQDGRVVRQGP
jgi:excinuclease ABC subunit A